MRFQDKIKAIKLRKRGKTYSEIIKTIPNLSKSTLSNWLKYVELTEKEQNRLEKRSRSGREKARFLAAKTNREKRILRMNKTILEAEREMPKLMKNVLFPIGVALYWCEGTHKTGRLDFTNSDFNMIKIMIKWVNEICNTPTEKLKFRLYIHKIYQNEHCERFWSKKLNIPLSKIRVTYKPTPHKIKRNPDYKGCLRIECGGVESFRKFLGWKNALIKQFNI